MPAPKGNDYNKQWYEEEAKELFIKALEYAETDNECYCLGDAIYYSGIPYSTYDYLAEKYKDLGTIKKDTKNAVSRRINRGALKGDYNPASAIWRLKQLGEKDKHEDKEVEDKGSNKIEIEVSYKRDGDS